VFYASGGGEANESAIKLAIQHHHNRGNKKKNIIMGSWQSYHGNTLNALSAGGDIKRRKTFESILKPYPHVQTAHINDSHEEVLEYIELTHKKILEVGPENIAAFI